MAHHRHHGDDTYFIDQLCMVGLSGAFGVICLSMYFWQTWMLKLLLGEQFHLFVLGSGAVLLLLATIRGWTLWMESQPKPAIAGAGAKAESTGIMSSLPLTSVGTTPHQHHHHGACDHDHGDCDHHHHEHHDHDHDHDHHHGHDHDHADHDHGWAPWRYVVILAPIMLFFLGLPNKGPKAADYNVSEKDRMDEMVREARDTIAFVGLDEWSRLGWAAKLAGDESAEDAIPAPFKTIMDSVDDAAEREYYKGKTVSMIGVFVPDTRDPRFFSLVRFRLQCCAADAIDRRVSVFSREPITHIKRDGWAKVVGKVEYAKTAGGGYAVRIVTSGASQVTPSNPDVNPYIN